MVEGARVHYLRWGDKARPGLLLVHGNAAHAYWWSFIAPFLARDYNVAAIDLSGMGDSDWRAGGYTMLRRELTWARLGETVREVMRLSAVVFTLMMGARYSSLQSCSVAAVSLAPGTLCSSAWLAR